MKPGKKLPPARAFAAEMSIVHNVGIRGMNAIYNQWDGVAERGTAKDKVDFANFALRIPGFSISVVRYIDDKTHQLRYVLRNRATDEVLFVVIFTLLYGQALENRLESEQKVEESRNLQNGVGNENVALERPETSSSQETPTSSEQSRSSSPALNSDSEPEDRATRQEKETAASTLASSIYSGFAALGFGRAPSSASSEATSKSTSPERGGTDNRSLDQKVQEMESSKVEEYLKTKASTD